MNNQIFVLGSANIDHVLNVPTLPRPGETLSGQTYNIFPGGKGANQAVACAKLDGKTRFMACLGQDAFGDQLVTQFAESGIDTSLIEQIDSCNTGVALIFVDQQAENCIGISAQANALLTPEKVAKRKTDIAEAGFLLASLETPVDGVHEATRIANENNTKVILNPAPAKPLSDDLLSCIDIITPNQTEAEVLSGVVVHDINSAKKAAKVLHGKGIETVLITMGSQGAFISDASGSRMIESFKVSAIDTTAAGDTFNGAMLVALAEGQNIDEAARFGNAAAALSVTRHGAQASIPTRSETDQFLTSSCLTTNKVAQ